MSRMVFLTFGSMLSGTNAPTIRPKRVSSLMKKKEMKTTENSPTTNPITAEATEPKMPEMFEKSSTSVIFPINKATPSNSSPTQGMVWMIQPLAWSMMLWLSMPSMVCRMEASRTMLVTTGITCMTNRANSEKMMISVNTASNPSGADFPLILILRSSLSTGCPISETTKASRM